MIVVTAPTGNIGHQVLRHLLDGGEPIRVITRDQLKLLPQIRARVEVVQGSHGDTNIVTKAFAGAEAVFWLLPPDPRAESVDAAYVDFTRPACEAIKSQRVKRVVDISALGRGLSMAGRAGFVTASLAMDDLIASTGVDLRSVTCPSFMDNTARQTEPIKNQGAFFGPISGDRKMPTCATRDIAATAAGLLLDPLWSGQSMLRFSAPKTCPSTTWRNHVGGTGQTGALPADPVRSIQVSVRRSRHVRGHGAGNDRHVTGQE